MQRGRLLSRFEFTRLCRHEFFEVSAMTNLNVSEPDTQRSETGDKPLLTCKSFWLFVGLVVLGLASRIINFAHARSLWLDELLISFQITAHTVVQMLFNRLESGHVAPPGFLIITKYATSLFGVNEFSLRVLPFIFSIFGILVACSFAHRTTALSISSRAVFLALLSLSPVLGLYAAEGKQYGVDVAITVWLLALALQDGPLIDRWKQLALWGGCALFFSHPAVFILAGIGFAIIIERETWQTNRSRLQCGAVFVTWLVSFALVFAPVLNAGASNPALIRFWRAGFGPGWPNSWSELRWYLDSGVNLMEVAFSSARRFGAGEGDPRFFVPGLLLGLMTAIGLLFSGLAIPRLGRITIVVLAGALIASSLRLYPFRGRLILYLVPFVYLGAGGCFHGFHRWPKLSKAMSILGAVLLAGLAAPPALWGLCHPYDKPQIKLAMECVKASRLPKDTFYLLPSSKDAFLHYSNGMNIRLTRIKDIRWSYKQQKKSSGIKLTEVIDGILPLDNSRIWVVGFHRTDTFFPLLSSLDAHGMVVQKCIGEGAEAWLLQRATQKPVSANTG